MERCRTTPVEKEDDSGHRCEHCGLVFDWRYQLKNHLNRRKVIDRCPLSTTARGVGTKRYPDPKPTPPAESLYRCLHCKHVFVDEDRLDRHLERRKRLGYCRKPRKRRKAKAKPKRKASKRKRDPLSVQEGWADDEYIGT